MSALSLMASADNKWISVGEGDLVVLSSHAIPGNETNVGKVIDGLCRLGAEVVHSGLAEVHVSGHAKRDELRTMLSLVRPECFIPFTASSGTSPTTPGWRRKWEWRPIGSSWPKTEMSSS